jgi:hypothetical protein
VINSNNSKSHIEYALSRGELTASEIRKIDIYDRKENEEFNHENSDLNKRDRIEAITKQADPSTKIIVLDDSRKVINECKYLQQTCRQLQIIPVEPGKFEWNWKNMQAKLTDKSSSQQESHRNSSDISIMDLETNKEGSEITLTLNTDETTLPNKLEPSFFQRKSTSRSSTPPPAHSSGMPPLTEEKNSLSSPKHSHTASLSSPTLNNHVGFFSNGNTAPLNMPESPLPPSSPDSREDTTNTKKMGCCVIL